MKISITLYNKEYTINSIDDEQNIDSVVEAFKGLLVAAGYHPHSVDPYFNTEGTWFPEEDLCVNEKEND